MEIKYDSNGNLSPYGKIEVNEKEFRDCFVEDHPGSKKRTELYAKFLEYQKALLDSVKSDVEQLIDGSWVSSKPDPQDIDLVNLVKIRYFCEQDFKDKCLISKFGSKERFDVDAYLVIVLPEDDPRYKDITKNWLDYWEKLWSFDRNGNEKGYIVMKATYNEVNHE